MTLFTYFDFIKYIEIILAKAKKAYITLNSTVTSLIIIKICNTFT